jgi:phenylalanyl-tRNA synthetase beta chain
MTLFDLKGVVQAILRRVGAQAVEFTSVDSTALTPGQAIQIWLEGEAIGYLGQVDDPWAERFDTGPLAVFVAELRLEPLLRCFLQTPRFSRIPVFPPVLRDLSLLVPSSVQASSLLRVIRAAGGEWLTQAELFDRYLGPGVPTGSQSLAVHLEFQNPHRTLQSAEVEEWMAGIVAALDTELGAKLRG